MYRGIELKVEHTVNVYSLFSAVAVLMLYYAEMFYRGIERSKLSIQIMKANTGLYSCEYTFSIPFL